MNKSELVMAIAERSKMEKGKVESVLNSFVDVVMDQVAKDDKIQLVGFGTFERRHREARTGRNPQTGEEIKIPASEVPAFKPGKNFKDIVNGVS